MAKKILTIIAVGMGVAALYILSAFVYPDVGALKRGHPAKSALMEYRERQWASQGKDVRIRHVYVPLRRISPLLVKAVIIAEDDKFWRHEGFDFEAMKLALEKDIRERRLKAGGSTITQQLAKNLFLSPSKNPFRKLREAILAWRMERTLSKRRIVELYLNYAEWGEGIFGIEAAARHYYGKHASELGADEAARLAAVLPNPLRYNPTSTTSNYVAGRARRIYRIMTARGIVIPEFKAVMEEPETQESSDADQGDAASATSMGAAAPQGGMEGFGMPPDGKDTLSPKDSPPESTGSTLDTPSPERQSTVGQESPIDDQSD